MREASLNQPDDLARLCESWEVMSAHYMPGRDELVTAAVDAIVEQAARPRIVELGSGPGNTLRRLRSRLPDADLVGIDNDPVLREIHDRVTSASTPVLVIDADLNRSSWIEAATNLIEPTVIVAIQLLHYFPPGRFEELLAEIRRAVGPDGWFVHIDQVPAATPDRSSPNDGPDRESGSVAEEPWDRWWAEAGNVKALDDAFRMRRALVGDWPESAEYHPNQVDLYRHLTGSGFDIHHRLQRRSGSSLLTIAQARAVPPT